MKVDVPRQQRMTEKAVWKLHGKWGGGEGGIVK